MSDFVHLHVHSEYSLLDGAIRLNQSVLSDTEQDKILHISPLTEALKAMGMSACAITDHGNLFGVHTFVSAMRDAGSNPSSAANFMWRTICTSRLPRPCTAATISSFSRKISRGIRT